MKKFTAFSGLVAPLDRPNVDTDAIIPKQFLKSIKRSGFGKNLFDDWRYFDVGEPDSEQSTRRPNPDFVLNQPRYAGAEILLARENFGCGSSREHAVWALDDYGIRVIIAPSFADIFFNNCFKSGLLPVCLPSQVVEQLFAECVANPGYRISVDLQAQQLSTPGGDCYEVAVDNFRKHCLLNGLDDIGLTLEHTAAIRAYETKRRQQSPWLFADAVQGTKS